MAKHKNSFVKETWYNENRNLFSKDRERSEA